MTMRQSYKMKAVMKWGIGVMLLHLAPCFGHAQLPEVDIGLFKADSATLEVRLKADENFDKVVSNIAFTIRWKNFTGASLDDAQQTMPQQAYIPMAKSDSTHQEGSYRYQIFAGFGMNAMDQFNADWQQGNEIVLMTIPVKKGLGKFQIVNDSWTGDINNNGDFYVSLNGEDRTGSIYKSTVDFCSHLSVTTDPENVSCKSGMDGTASVDLAGDATLFTATWSTGATRDEVTGLAAGTYEVTVSGAGGCVLQEEVSINEPAQALASPVLLDQGDTLRGYHPLGAQVTYSWYLNGKEINTADGEVLRIDKSGNYFVAVEDSNGCFKTSDTLTVDITGQPGKDSQRDVLRILPNPHDGLFKIRVNIQSDRKSKLEVSNPLGQVVYKKHLTGSFQGSLDFREMSSGVYLVKLEIGDEKYSRKTILQ